MRPTLCTVPVTASGPNYSAQCPTSALTPTNNTVTAMYSETAGLYTVAAPATDTLTVTALAPTFALTTSPVVTTTTANSAVTFVATLSGITFTPTAPSGSVVFKLGATTLCTVAVAANGPNYSASCPTSALTPSNHTVTATYSETAGYYTVATPATDTITVTAIPTKLTLAASGTQAVDSPVTFTATLGLSPSGTLPVTAQCAHRHGRILPERVYDTDPRLRRCRADRYDSQVRHLIAGNNQRFGVGHLQPGRDGTRTLPPRLPTR